MKDHHGCPVQGTINAFSGKWKVLAIWHLAFGPKRFAQLRDLLQGVSEKVLTAQLRQLETDGIVRRKVKDVSPPEVTYSLTRAGEELIRPMSVLCAWGTRYLGIPPSLPRYPKVQRKPPRRRSIVTASHV
jgi:DNA-binding HxlR family transcriptional regulator